MARHPALLRMRGVAWWRMHHFGWMKELEKSILQSDIPEVFLSSDTHDTNITYMLQFTGENYMFKCSTLDTATVNISTIFTII